MRCTKNLSKIKPNYTPRHLANSKFNTFGVQSTPKNISTLPPFVETSHIVLDDTVVLQEYHFSTLCQSVNRFVADCTTWKQSNNKSSISNTTSLTLTFMINKETYSQYKKNATVQNNKLLNNINS